MSSFRKRTMVASIAGTRPSPYNASQPLLSTGLASLDDLIGGGLPLSTVWLVTGDDHASSYASLVLRFWLSQSVECAHHCLVVGQGDQVYSMIDNLMDIDARSDGSAARDEVADRNEPSSSEGIAMGPSRGGGQDQDQDKMKIAFRYQRMKKHKTTIDEPPAKSSQEDVYCSLFDLTTKRNISNTEKSRIEVIDVDHLHLSETAAFPKDLYDLVFDAIETKLTRGGHLIFEDVSASRQSKAFRIALSNFGGPSWGSSSPKSMYRFLVRLRSLLRRSTASVCLTFPSHLHPLQTMTRLSHATDVHVALTSFSTSATFLAQFPRHQGLLAFPKLPTVGALVPSSMKLSVLRGLGGDEEGNDLGFRIKRRRLIIEILRADEPVSFGPATTDAVEDKGAAEARSKTGKVSVSRLIHEKPELYEF